MRTSLRRLGRGFGALLALALLLVGIPVALSTVVGSPLPQAVPSWSGIRSALTTSGVADDVIVKGLAVVCWIAWSVLAASVIVEVAGVVRGRGSRRIPLAGPVQALAANLVAAAVLILSPAAPRASSSAQPLAVVLALPKDATLVAAASADPRVSPPALPAVAAPAAGSVTSESYTVVRRDTLWGIAEAHLGDPFRWPEVFELNRGRPQPDGRSLTDPNLIQPGWVLALPSAGAAPSGTSPPPSPNGSTQPRTPDRNGAATTIPPPTTPTTASSAPAATTTSSVAPRDAHPVPATTTPRDGRRPPAGDQARPRDPGSGIHLPAGSFVGLSLAAGISASLAAARLHRRRRRVPQPPQDGIALDEPLATESVRRLRRADLARRSRPAAVGPTGSRSLPTDGSAEPRKGGMAAILSVGDRNGEGVELDLLTAGGVGLSGPGAAAVARSVIADFVSNASAHAAEVIVAGPPLAENLFPGVEPFVGLDVAPNVEAAITRLEVELVHRTRLIDNNDDTDFSTYVEQNPAEPLPVVLLVAEDIRGGLRLRLDAVVSVGRRLGIGALVLSPPPTMATISVASDGSVEDITGHAALGRLGDADLFSLEPFDARELLGVVAAGRGAFDDVDSIADVTSESFAVEDTSAGGPVVVHLLGIYRIAVSGEEIRTGLRTKARELLAYLLLHPQGKSVEAIVDAIWPDADPTRGTEGFRTAVGNLRKVVRAKTGNQKAAVVERVGERYRLEVSLFECDLWRLEAALRDANLADNDALITAALERARKECAGHLLDGAYYEWAETQRERVRRQSVDALARLAQMMQDVNDHGAAAAVLEEAVRLDPYSEQMYRSLMSVQIRLGLTDSVEQTYKELEGRLSELDVDPEESTAQLASRAFGRHSRFISGPS